METGVYTKNTLIYISVNQIYRKLGAKLCEALLAKFSGCDYTASFNRKGKVRLFKFSKRMGWKNSFAKYMAKKIKSVHETRFEMFLEKYKPKGDDKKITCVKKLDGSSLPPCSRVLLEKNNRTKYIAAMWRSSSLPYHLINIQNTWGG